MALDSQSAKGQGNVLAFTLPEWVETLTLTCTAKDDDRDRAGSITKKLQVLGWWFADFNCSEISYNLSQYQCGLLIYGIV